MRKALTLRISALVPAAVHAQPAPATLTGFDVTASIGLFSADRSEAGAHTSWSGSFFKGVSAGYYWTDHLKTEVEFGFPNPTEGETFSNSQFPNGSFVSTYDERTYSGPKFAVAQVYQFERNSMFHPYALVGLDLDREHIDLERHTFISSGRTSFERDEISSSNRMRAGGFTGAGFKAYVSERTFFKGEIKLDIGRSLNQVMWKAGVGVDFTTPRRKAAARETRAPAEPRGREPVDVWRAYATLLQPGSLVDVAAAGEDRITGELLDVDDSGVRVKPKTRLVEPTRTIPFERMEMLRLHIGPSAAERAGAVAAGIGTGTGVFFGIAMILFAALGGG